MRIVSGEQCTGFRAVCSWRALLIHDMKWKNVLQEGLRSNFVPITELFAIILVHCFPSDWRNTYHEDSAFRFVWTIASNGSNAESYPISELDEYFWEMNGRGLPNYDLPEADLMLPLSKSSTTEDTEVGQVVAARKKLWETLPNLSEEQIVVLNTIVRVT